MERIERRDILLAGIAAASATVLHAGEPGEPGLLPTIPGWIARYDPKELVEVALDQLDYVLNNTRWNPPKKVTDTTIVPHYQDTSSLVRDYAAGTHEDNEVIGVAGVNYKLDWIMSSFELVGPVEIEQLRSVHVLPTLYFWQKHFSNQLGDMRIVTRLPTKDVSSRRKVNEMRSFTMVKHKLAMRATVMAMKNDRATIIFDSLVGSKS